jgi:hypothetical protein
MGTIEDLIRSGQVSPPSRDVLHQARTALEAQIVVEQTSSRVTRSHAQRRRRQSVLAVASVAALAVAITATVTNVGQKPTFAAAAVLDRAAQAAVKHPALAPLRAGQYYYEKNVILQNCGFSVPSSAGTETPVVYLSSVVAETWTEANGSGREQTTPQGPGRFLSAQEQSLWAASGQSNPCLLPSDTRTIPPSTAAEPGVTSLPTDPTALGALLAAGRVNDVGQVYPSSPTGWCPSQNGDAAQVFAPGQICNVAAQFDIVNNLLGYPGAPLLLGPVLYHVLAQLPGVEVIGSQSDAIGRTGTAIEDPSSGDVVVLDPSTGLLLETETLATSANSIPGVALGTVLDSTTYAAIGVANAMGSVPN